ncbi:hypothetical protein FLX56_17725 [Synechococcus moorigangaii CMS01]|nr:hypothetical protein [Synechococcus moorigangaii CMS01]
MTSSVIVTLGNENAFAGQFNVVTTAGSTPTGAVNFPTRDSRVSLNLMGVQATATTQAIALNEGMITQAQAAAGLGSGGAVLDLSADPQALAAIATIANQGKTPLSSTIASLGTNANVADITITMPTDRSLTIGQILNNLSTAIVTEDPVALPTALNDAAIAMRTALMTPESQANVELQTAGRTVASLLEALRNSAVATNAN